MRAGWCVAAPHHGERLLPHPVSARGFPIGGVSACQRQAKRADAASRVVVAWQGMPCVSSGGFPPGLSHGSWGESARGLRLAEKGGWLASRASGGAASGKFQVRTGHRHHGTAISKMRRKLVPPRFTPLPPKRRSFSCKSVAVCWVLVWACWMMDVLGCSACAATLTRRSHEQQSGFVDVEMMPEPRLGQTASEVREYENTSPIRS